MLRNKWEEILYLYGGQITLDALYKAVDWSDFEVDHEKWAEKNSDMLLTDENSRYMLRCVLLREAFYGEDEDKRKGASLMLGPAYKQALEALRKAGLAPRRQVQT